MPEKTLREMLDQVPEEQRKVLEKMMALGLVKEFGASDATGVSGVLYTRAGRDFLNLIKAVTAVELSTRTASAIALHELAEGTIVFPGFAQPKGELGSRNLPPDDAA